MTLKRGTMSGNRGCAIWIVNIMTILLTIFSICCVAIVLSLFWPLLRGVPNPLIYFTSGGGGPRNQKQGTADLLIRRRVLLENLRDIQIERDFGKLNPEEYATLARPLFAELEDVEERLKERGSAPATREVRRNRLGWFCPDCGNLNHAPPPNEDEDPDAPKTADDDLKHANCVQCGRPARIEWDLAGSAPASTSPGTQTALQFFFAGALALGALVTPGGGLFAQPPVAGDQAGSDAPVVFQGLIANGTRGGAPATVESLELIQLGEGVMQTVQVLSNVGPRFAFDAVPRPSAPHLIRATYRGERYSTMVPPAPNFYSKPQAITVFETGAERRSVQITGAMRVTKLRAGGLAIQQYMVIANQSAPPRSYDPRGYHVFIPDGAEAIRASLQHESTRVPVPLSMDPVPDKKNRYRIDRGVRPGNSQLVIDYLLPDVKFIDALPEEDGVAGLPPARTPNTNENPHSAGALENPHSFRIIFWQPANAKPTVSGGRFEDIQIPNIGPALRVIYPAKSAGQGDASPATVSYDFSAGGVFVENPLQSDENPLFNSPIETTVGVIAGLCVFFLIASVIAGSGLQLVSGSRRKS